METFLLDELQISEKVSNLLNELIPKNLNNNVLTKIITHLIDDVKKGEMQLPSDACCVIDITNNIMTTSEYKKSEIKIVTHYNLENNTHVEKPMVTLYKNLMPMFQNDVFIKDTLKDANKTIYRPNTSIITLLKHSQLPHWKKLGILFNYLSKFDLVTIDLVSYFFNKILASWNLTIPVEFKNIWICFMFNMVHCIQLILKNLDLNDINEMTPIHEIERDERKLLNIERPELTKKLCCDEALSPSPVLYDDLKSCTSVQRFILQSLETIYARFIYAYLNKINILEFEKHKKDNYILVRKNKKEFLGDTRADSYREDMNTNRLSLVLFINTSNIHKIKYYHKVFGFSANFLYKIHNAAVNYPRAIIYDSKLKKGTFTDIFEIILFSLLMNHVRETLKIEFNYVFEQNRNSNYGLLDIEIDSNKRKQLLKVIDDFVFWKTV